MEERMIPKELRYTKEHEWIMVDGDVATVGITDYAQGELGDVVYLELPDPGTAVEQMKAFGLIEAVKTEADLYSPLTGEVTERNDSAVNDPGVINSSPYEDGWLIKIKFSNPGEVDGLLTAEQYAEHIGDGSA
jgi:glycine cleavage system H protein